MASCAHCGALFEPKATSERQRRARRYCSRACASRATRPRSQAIDRIMEHAMPEPNSGCWLWLGSIERKGYGHLRFNGRTVYAHRLSLATFKSLAAGLNALHTCDVPCCVNPDHLYAGTAYENRLDAVCRNRVPTGERHPQAKLTDDIVRAIRKDTRSPAAIARGLGVTVQTIRLVQIGATWRHVE